MCGPNNLKIIIVLEMLSKIHKQWLGSVARSTLGAIEHHNNILVILHDSLLIVLVHKLHYVCE